MNKFVNLFFATILICTVGCVHQKTNKLQKEDSPLHDIYQEILAKQSMIPDIPLGANLQYIFTDYEQPEHVEIVYMTQQSFDEIMQWYIQEMERLGWDKLMKSELKKGILVFQSPLFICTICIDKEGIYNKVSLIKKYRG